MVDDLKQGGEELLHETPKPKGALAAREEKVLAFWNKEKIFEKSLAKPSPRGEYVFYDGPPFATGLPHYGHLLQSAIKDAIPRYRTMRGYHVPRIWGWDCHGLPLENQIEQELGIKTKRDIEAFGIEKFNKAARDAVLRYAEDWRRIIPRFGRWVDMEHDYKTMDSGYTESVWWAFKNLYNRGLMYEGFKAMHLCPRCGTTLSNFEVAQGYKDIDDWAVTVKLPLVDEPGTALLIWTTTPWTLPGNAAAAIKEDAVYVKVKVGEEFFIIAKELLENVLSKKGEEEVSSKVPAEIVGEIKGKELVGKRYEPPFDYFKNELHKHKTHAFKVYVAPYVTLEDGTGIVHLAPAYGAEDLELAQKEKIPLIHHVTDEGKFVATVKDFAHLSVKPKGRHMETDAKIIENLKKRGLLFNVEKIKHSYPHCWRCETPLLNWAANSWFVNVQKVKSKLLVANAAVTWVPKHVGTGRFNNGLESAPDWAISRSRYWGAPLPVWRHSKTKELKVIGSVDELLALVRRSGNKYFVMRHGEAEHNLEGSVDCGGRSDNHLTEQGRKDTLESATRLHARRGIDLIITSPLLRARETGTIVQKELGLPDSAVMVDERLREVGFGIFDGQKFTDWKYFFKSYGERFLKAPNGGETYTELHRRVGDFLFEIERRYTNKKILIISHDGPIGLLCGVSARKTLTELSLRKIEEFFLKPAETKEVLFTPYPHNEQYELDLHRPYIDDLMLGDSLKGEWKRVLDVFDCWFESGSMPYASNGYPQSKKSFNPKRLFGLLSKGYPADFIAESIDQTRGWFYSLIVLGVALFDRSPYKAVVTNGLVLAEDGRKMSKKLKNYPDPMELVERFGADAVRYYLLSSPVIRGEDLRFSARGVEEVSKKLLMRLDNVRSFYELYAPKVVPELSSENNLADVASADEETRGLFREKVSAKTSSNVLDRWILSRLGELVKETTDGFEKYELDAATRPLTGFIDDLSTWYLRRSRDRFKTEDEDKNAALATLRHALLVTAKVMAPVMPFFAEDLYRRVKAESDEKSVHLCDWPAAPVVDMQLIHDMKRVREISSLALQEREKAGIKIRQPLAKLSVKVLPPNEALKLIVADEANVKNVLGDMLIAGEVALDTTLTPELKEEGMVRELVRSIQAWRKEQKYSIGDRPAHTLVVGAEGKRVAEKYRAQIMAQAGLSSLEIQLMQDA